METVLAMPLMLQVYWGLALLSSLVFVIQAIMMFVGMDSDTDVAHVDMPDDVPAESGGEDFDSDGFHLVSVKSIICFILGFGWTGALLWNAIESRWLLGLLAVVLGFVFMSLIAFLLFQVKKLDKDNTFRVQHVVGKVAEVYLRIPAAREGSGKVIVSINGSMHELDALTDHTSPIATGDKVRITEALKGDAVMVETL